MKFWLSMILLCTSAWAQAHSARPQVEMQTNEGDIIVELYPDKAPKTVANFLHYVTSGFYDGTVFHRVVKDFVVQGGGFDQDLKWRQPGDPIPNEADNGLTNEIGTIAMAHARDPNSATSQFFFNIESNKFLNHYSKDPAYYGHCVFGKIVKGLDVVKKISNIQTGAGGSFDSDVPVKPIVVYKVAVLPEATEAAPVKQKSKGKSRGKPKNELRRNLAGT